jgi:hypothetical protein
MNHYHPTPRQTIGRLFSLSQRERAGLSRRSPAKAEVRENRSNENIVRSMESLLSIVLACIGTMNRRVRSQVALPPHGLQSQTDCCRAGPQRRRRDVFVEIHAKYKQQAPSGATYSVQRMPITFHRVERLEPLQRALVTVSECLGILLRSDDAAHDFPTVGVRQFRDFRNDLRAAHRSNLCSLSCFSKLVHPAAADLC